MSFVTTQPEMLSTAASDLASIGSAMNALKAAAAGLTTEVAPAAADEVSALTAARFTSHGQLYQMVSAQAAAIHDQFVAMLACNAGSYADTEAANAVAVGLGGG
ncbi:PE family protein [Mycobacterium haemophilum]|uniref:PE family protein n=1 Tax=Mycobacterium haemophilum TaxID=29311 RepID=A0A0I9YVX1_9MYCO|nr:PE family protein [Mycobacterium haemophilum]AKN15360.1 PE family protein [Mycobacterium haemophilum DSM 44634]KLO33199.1 PE family protein [Mycobacterium haemophilum]KLO38155.1 PE family protein [Mycobacterium haemophilum]KLO44477.1 PE family protein [Mycobacterium haemophilum]KLO49510.1 PE family protein [Mycobacterium haemophilum]